ncbi:lysophosphatidic acid acyltransferase loa1 [Saccharomyces pastorianus]|uniref:Lysophosphatidic acid acyltransferase loa1 n=1 Tax=Saccharomyces pastorianus TaxID=27292 RepID=A0A6C1E189_SACPS|nr:lysophosphatidic acid acyltransferase loa1 [Saccharomyces pastorianus]
MEKYTNWRDNGTGIAPFLPNTIRKPSKVMTACLLGILGVKTIIMLPLIMLYLLTGQNNLLGLILKFTFSWKEEITVQGIKKRDVRKSKHYPQKGKLYICNCTSPLDAFSVVLLAQGPVTLLVPSNDIVYKVSIREFINFILAGVLDIKLKEFIDPSIKTMKLPSRHCPFPIWSIYLDFSLSHKYSRII